MRGTGWTWTSGKSARSRTGTFVRVNRRLVNSGRRQQVADKMPLYQ
jgi:hypothetical protein